MRIGFVSLFCFLVINCFSQDEIKFFAEKTNTGYVLFVSNNVFCPLSISLDLTLENLSFSEGMRKVFVIPAKSEKVKVGELNIETTGKKYKYSYKYRYVYGNIDSANYNKDYPYFLPFAKGKSFTVHQGYNGNFSHQNENALDFTMPEGTEIVAAREGIVVKVIQNNTESCLKEECKKFNNFVTVYHSDGTFASYVHLKYNGSKVKVGDVVKKGEVIAYSGNTGWSSGPHLHFICYLPSFDNRISIATQFKIEDGNKLEILKEKTTYTRSY